MTPKEQAARAVVQRFNRAFLVKDAETFKARGGSADSWIEHAKTLAPQINERELETVASAVFARKG